MLWFMLHGQYVGRGRHGSLHGGHINHETTVANSFYSDAVAASSNRYEIVVFPSDRQLAHSRFATGSQVAEFLRLGRADECRRTFNWRIKRLMDRGFVDRRTCPGGKVISS